MKTNSKMRVLKSVRYKKQQHLDQGTKKVDFWLPVVLEKLKAQNLKNANMCYFD